MATSLGELAVKIGADTAGLKEGAKEAGDALNELGQAGKVLSIALGAVTTLSIAAGVAFAVNLTKNSLETIDAQSKLAYRLGATVTGLQATAYAAELAGESGDAFNKSFGRMDATLAQAARTATGPAYDALQRLGLSAKELLKQDIDVRLGTIAAAMEHFGYSTAQQSEVLKTFGIRGQGLISLFEEGGKKLKEARQDVIDFGVAVSGIDAIKVEQANEAWTRANLIFKAIGNQIAIVIAPVIKELGDNFAEAGKQSGGFGNVIQDMTRKILIGLGTIYDGMVKLFEKTKEFYDELMLIPNGITAIASVLNKTIDALTGGLSGTTVETKNLKRELESVPTSDKWLKWFDEVTAKANHAAEEVAAAQKKMQSNSGPELDNLSEQERKALEIKLASLKKGIANQDQALAEQRDKELLEVKEFERKKIVNATQAADLNLQIETKYQKDKKALIQSVLEETILKEDERNNRANELRLKQLDIFEANKTITAQKAMEIRKKLEQQHALDLQLIYSRQYAALAGIVDSTMSQISQIVGQQGGAAFEIMKGISMATALVKGYEAVVSAYAAGNAVGGPPVGAAFAAIAAAGVAAQIANIARTTPSSSGGTVTAPSGGGGGAAAASGPAPGANAGQTLTLQGINPNSLFSGGMMRDLVRQLIQYQRDGGTIVLA